MLVTLGLGAVVALLVRLALPRRRWIAIPPGAELHWGDGFETDDPFQLILVTATSESVLAVNEDPAKLLDDARRIAATTGARLVLPPELAEFAAPPLDTRRPVTIASAIALLGPAWNAQPRASQAALGAGVFVLLVFVVSARAEAGLSALSVGLPLLSVATALTIGSALLGYRLQLSLGPDGLRAERVLWGFRRVERLVSSEHLLGLRVIGHRGFAGTHLLIETTDGPFALRVAEEMGVRAVAHCHPAAEARDRLIVRAERLETSGALP